MPALAHSQAISFSWRPLQSLLAALLVWLLLAGAAAAATFAPGKFAAIVVDEASGEVLYARQADAQRYPASLTKVMTLYLAFEALERGDLKLDDKIVMSPRAAARPPSKLGLAAGERLTVQEALEILVVKSANDVATALAEEIAGTESAFARRMTAKARELGMTRTRFANASGLPQPQNVSTARDMAILAHAILRDHPERYRLFSLRQTNFRGRLIRGHNALLRSPGVDGLKTGFINASGFNLLTSGVKDGRRLVAVVLGGPTARARDEFMRQLLNASFTSLSVKYAGLHLPVGALLGDLDPLPRAGADLSPGRVWDRRATLFE